MSRLHGTVLEIDMGYSCCSLLRLVLNHNNVKYIRAYDLDEAIKLAKRKQPDVIFLEAFMPVSGFEIYETLQKNQNTKHIPVVFYSLGPEIEKKLKELGVPYLSKPVDFDELFEYLATYLEVVEE